MLDAAPLRRPLAATLAILAALLVEGPVASACDSGQCGRSLIEADLRDGRLERRAAVVEMLRWIFAPEKCLPRYRGAERCAVRCVQPTVARYRTWKDEFDPVTTKELEAYLEPRASATSGWSSLVSPLGYFELHYQTTGPDSVPAEDVDPQNGIPDFVERCAEYADQSWSTEVGLGFTAPLLPPDGTYDITFQDLGIPVYGYADISGLTTEIVIHNNFAGGAWPPNDDPDGPELGRAKATIAHEFKHASQYTTSGWTEGTWNELDAAWVEEVVFPQTDDYHNFLGGLSNSQLDAPWTPLDNDDGQGNYEDCLWQQYLSIEHGDQIIVDLWDLRAAAPWKDVAETFEDVLATRATSWRDSYPRYLETCWFTGFRALPPFGFPDAPELWTMEFVDSPTNSYPFAVVDTVAAIAGHSRRFNKGSASGRPRVRFDGEDSAGGLTVSLIVVEADYDFEILRPELDAANDFEVVVSCPFPSLRYLGVLVTNANLEGEVAAYELEVMDDQVTSVVATLPPATTRPRLEAPRPNPTAAGSRIGWSLPRPARVTLRIVDAAGRAIRTLRRNEHSANRDDARWDGRTDAGREASAGVYWAVLDADGHTVARRIVRLR